MRDSLRKREQDDKLFGERPTTKDSTEEQTTILITNCCKKNLHRGNKNKSVGIHTDPFIGKIKRYVNLFGLKMQLRTECTG